jgi:DNA (cytosine-5)-methyltransferase 1
MSILRSSLRDLGYDVHEMEVNSADWNMLEHRTRMVMVAVTRGIDFSFDALQRPDPAVHTFGEIMDVVDPAHSTWGNIDYLWGKLERDKADGKGFAPTVVDASSTRLPVLNKSLHKRQSTGTFIRHPTNPSLYRIPTVNEHARAKGIPASLVEGTTQTLGHESLGQSISMPPFVAVFEALGKALRAYGMNCNPIRLPSITRGEALTAA